MHRISNILTKGLTALSITVIATMFIFPASTFASSTTSTSPKGTKKVDDTVLNILYELS